MRRERPGPYILNRSGQQSKRLLFRADPRYASLMYTPQKNRHTKAFQLCCAFAVLGLAFLIASASLAEEHDADRSTWDLTTLYPSGEAWEQELIRLRGEIPVIAAYQGQLGDSASSLLAALQDMSSFMKDVSRLWVYASNYANVNVADPAGQALVGQTMALYQEASAATSFLAPELIALGEQTVEAFLAEEPRLAPHAHNLDDILRRAPHTLSEEAERVLSLSQSALATPENARSILANAEIDWPVITLSTGEDVTLNASGYSFHRQAENRADRIAVFDAFWAKHKDFESTFGATLNGEVQGNVFEARARNYENTLSYFLAGDNIPQEVYRTLVEVTNDRIDVLHRYFELRGRMLQIENLGYHDIYPPMVSSEREYPIEETRDLVLEASAILGETYGQQFAEAASERWMHVYPQPGKRSGAYMSGAAYDVHPFILLNHTGDYNSASTYAHEWGHALHQLLTNQNQTYENADFSIFTTEIAAIAKEMLLQDYMLQNAQSDQERLYFLGYALEQMRGTFFRQVMFSEFELAIHEAVERGEALTGPRMTEIYGELLERYHGHEKGVLAITDREKVEWAFIPHFYFEFYVYQYATSIAGASYFVNELKTGGQAALDNYLGLLKAGGSDYPVDLLKDAGLDMTTRAPYDAVIDRMDNVMDQIEALLDKMPVN